jgi:hypothetical protein
MEAILERGGVISLEPSPILAEGKIFFGKDVNDREGGKGEFYARDRS